MGDVFSFADRLGIPVRELLAGQPRNSPYDLLLSDMDCGDLSPLLDHRK